MANGHGGRRNGSGRKPGMTTTAGEAVLSKFRRATAAEILAGANEVQLWRNLLSNKDKWLVLSAMRYLTDRRDGKPYQGMHPLQRLPGDANDPKLAEVLRNLLPPAHSAEITVTEKQTRIDLNCDQNAPQSLQDAPGRTLESKAPIRKAKRLKAPSPAPVKTPVTIDALTASESDPSGREKGVGHSGAESHTENIQVSVKSMETKEKDPEE